MFINLSLGADTKKARHAGELPRLSGDRVRDDHISLAGLPGQWSSARLPKFNPASRGLMQLSVTSPPQTGYSLPLSITVCARPLADFATTSAFPAVAGVVAVAGVAGVAGVVAASGVVTGCAVAWASAPSCMSSWMAWAVPEKATAAAIALKIAILRMMLSKSIDREPITSGQAKGSLIRSKAQKGPCSARRCSLTVHL